MRAEHEIVPYTDNDERNKSRTQNGLYHKQLVPNRLREIQEQWDRSASVYRESLMEAATVNRYLDGKHFSPETLAEIRKSKRIPEKYNLVLRISLLLEGYFAKTVTTALAKAVRPDETVTALVHNEDFKYTQRNSNWESTRKELVRDLITTGLCAASYTVIPTERKDDLGRVVNKLRIDWIPSHQVLPDHRAKRHNMDDAKFLHYWDYMSYSECVDEFGEEDTMQMKLMNEAGTDETDDLTDVTDTGILGTNEDTLYWKDGQSFFIVRSYQKDKFGNISVVYWHGDMLLKEVKLPIKTFPIVVIPLMRRKANRRYFTPLFDILPSQDAINQALLAFQKLIDTERIVVDKKAVPDKNLKDFVKKAKTIGEVLHVNTLGGIKIEYLSNQAQAHISKMYTSIQLIMETIGINEAFLGESKAGDSGRKFEGQRASSENTLDYIFTPINLLYEELLRTNIHLAGIYRQATEQVRFVDDLNQERWVQINEPFQMPTGEIDPMTGQPETQPVRGEVYDEQKGEWGIVYVNEKGSSLDAIDVEVEIHTAPYEDTDAIETAFLESILNGMGGQLLAQTQPGAVFYLYSILTKNLRTRDSERISMLFKQISQQLGSVNVEDPRLYMQGSQGGGQQGANGGGGSPAQQTGSQGGSPQVGQNAGGIVGAAGISGDSMPAGYNQPIGE